MQLSSTGPTYDLSISLLTILALGNRLVAKHSRYYRFECVILLVGEVAFLLEFEYGWTEITPFMLLVFQ